MDPVTVVVSALVAGAVGGMSGVVSSAISDAYQALKRLVVTRLLDAGKDARSVDDAPGSDVAKARLIEDLNAVGINDEIRRLAEELLNLLESGERGKFIVDASEAKGIIIGDHSVQHNTFN